MLKANIKYNHDNSMKDHRQSHSTVESFIRDHCGIEIAGQAGLVAPYVVRPYAQVPLDK